MRRQLLKAMGYQVVYDDARAMNRYIITYRGHVVEKYADWQSCLIYISRHTNHEG